jgi:hypothetical protein
MIKSRGKGEPGGYLLTCAIRENVENVVVRPQGNEHDVRSMIKTSEISDFISL